MWNRAFTAGTGLAVLAAAGCSTPAAPVISVSLSPAPPPVTAPAQQFDPPVRFETKALNIGLPPGGDVLLHGPLAFFGTNDAVTVTDLRTGLTVAELPPKGEQGTAYDNKPDHNHHDPVLATTSAGEQVVVPYVTVVPASGTTKNRERAELVIADATTGLSAGVVPVEAPANDYGRSTNGKVAIAGTRGDVAVLVFHPDSGSDPETVAVDLVTGRTLWRKTKLRARAVLGDTVVGEDGDMPEYVAGVGVADGKQRWRKFKSSALTVTGAGPKFVAVSSTDYGSGDDSFTFLDADGRSAYESVADIRIGSCLYDEQALAVCSGTNRAGDTVFGIDAASADVLWQLPTKDRYAPLVTAAWHGAAYGRAKSEAVVLDALTGEDKASGGPIFMVGVNGYGGVSNVPQFHPAIG